MCLLLLYPSLQPFHPDSLKCHHRDFSPKVGDFATVRVAPSGSGISSAVSTKLVIGTSAYMAPEAPRFDISAKLDSFAFGVVLLELLTGLPPLVFRKSF
jgi:serine/threonine protein kinase